MLNIHIYPTTFEYETRMLKITDVLVKEKIVDQVLIIAIAKNGLENEDILDNKRTVLRIATRLQGQRFWQKAMRFIEWSARIFIVLRRMQVTMVNCHSLSVFPICVILKWWHQAILVYEPHELETETVTFFGVRKKMAKIVEKLLIRQASQVIVVSPSISKQYCKDYGLTNIPVILNVPELNSNRIPIPNSILREKFKIPDLHPVFMYQGMLEEERGVLYLLEAFKQVSVENHLVFLGFGELESEIKKSSTSFSNIHFHPAVAPEEVLEYTLAADIGIALLDDHCLNHQFALPNKLFHYLHAGLPVIVSDLVEMGNLVEHYQCGWRVKNKVDSIVKRVDSLTQEEIQLAKKGVQKARNELHWGIETDKMTRIYSDLFQTNH